MPYITIILAIFTSLLFPFLFKIIDFYINNNSRLNERLKATQLYYELKSKPTSFIELERAAQAMVSNQNTTADLVDTFVELCRLDHDCRELNQDIGVVTSARKYLTFDIKQELKDRLGFIEELSSKSKRSKFKWKKCACYLLGGTITGLSFIYWKQAMSAVIKGNEWVNFYSDYQVNASIICFYLFFILILSAIFTIKHMNDIDSLNDAEKLLKKIEEKFLSPSSEIQPPELKEIEAKAS